jgi:hypothetical protein
MKRNDRRGIMSKSDSVGGPASPVSPANFSSSGGHPGMSLRDYLAAKAMASCMMPSTQGAQWATKDQLPGIAEFAYLAADAMLAERAK